MSVSTRTTRSLNIAGLILVLLGMALVIVGCQSNPAFSRSLGQAELLVRAILVIVGFLLMVAGYAIHEFLIYLVGFMVGGIFGAGIGALASHGDLVIALIGFVITGFIGAWLAALISCLAIFGAGFLAGAVMVGGLWLALFRSEPAPLLVLFGAIIGGFFMLALYKLWVVALTSALGAVLFGFGLGIHPILWIFFFLFGMVCQYGLAKATGHEEEVKPGYSREKETPSPAPALPTSSKPNSSVTKQP